MDAAMLNGPQGCVVLGAAPLTVGRAQDNQLVLHDAKVSAHHTEIRLEGQRHSIIDLESTNGTFINERRLEPNRPYRLHHLDMIRIGGAVFVYEVGGAVANASPRYAAQPVDEDASRQSTITAPFTPIPASRVEVMQNYRAYQQKPAFSAYRRPQRTLHTPPPGGLAAMSNNAAPAQTSRKGWQKPGVTLAVAGGIVLCGLVGFGLLGFAVFDAISGPSSTLNTYCDALKNQHYQTAYQQLDSNSQHKFSLSDFMRYVTDDNGPDHVTNCVVSNVGDANSRGSGTISYTYTDGGTKSISYTLSDEGDSWRITNVVASTPDITLNVYCDALDKRDYPTAYSQFSTEFKSALSESEFAHRFSSAGITSCKASNVQRDGPIALSAITYGDTKGNTIIFNAHLINENGVWKIDTQQP
ncbi:MAG TPA: FHA domain-containing protein [Ktedonobacteraceae bacterium]|nr:FHA domain-containing protein [Ktedonobacteraceae bacterium]